MNFKTMAKYFEYFKIGIKQSLEYKDDFYLHMLYIGFQFVILYLIWHFIYYLIPYKLPLSFNELMLYYGTIILISDAIDFTYISRFIQYKVLDGDLIKYFSKPTDFILSTSSFALGDEFFKFILSMLVLIIINLIYGNFNYFILFFVIHYLLVNLFMYLVSLCIGLMSFWVGRIWALSNIFNKLIFLFSGRAFPLSFLPLSLLTFVDKLPFKYLYYTSVLILLNKITYLEIIYSLKVLIAWNLLILIILLLIYSRAKKIEEVLGG